LWLAWEAAAKQGELPSESVLKQARQRVNWRALEISNDRLRLNVRGMQLSLNGIAQGYAADSARAALMAHGIAHAMIDAGETSLLGKAPDGQAWEFDIEDAVGGQPANARQDAPQTPIVQSDGRAMATSSDAHTSFSADHRHHHILDPRTGYSPTYWASVTVIASRCVVADALTKVFFMLPPSQVLAMARAWGVDVVLQDKAGRWRASPGAGARLPMA
jgi:thiamine biosynthesis lipoprotein